MVFVVGESVMVVAVEPVLHKYDVPPKALSVAASPLQTDGVPLTLAVGAELTETVLLEELVQPFAPITTTE